MPLHFMIQYLTSKLSHIMNGMHEGFFLQLVPIYFVCLEKFTMPKQSVNVGI
jgi:hypothetical protein